MFIWDNDGRLGAVWVHFDALLQLCIVTFQGVGSGLCPHYAPFPIIPRKRDRRIFAPRESAGDSLGISL